jgi:hypothetical protein
VHLVTTGRNAKDARRHAACCLLSAISSLCFAAGPGWRHIDKGLDFARWRVAMYDSLTGTGYCRMGEPDIAILRINPGRYRFQVFSYLQFGDSRDLPDIEEWQQKTGALAVFNAGQYYPDLSYMGLLISGDLRFSERQHPQFQAVFAAEPKSVGTRRARILDLKYSRFVLDSTPYTQIAQSFMLFDAKGKKRVKHGNWVANRTALAEDRRGNILVIVTEGGYTIWEFAELLQASSLGLIRAMSMDGGYESELCLKTRGFSYATYGQWETNDYGDISLPGIRIGLPAVIGVFRRER